MASYRVIAYAMIAQAIFFIFYNYTVQIDISRV